MSASAMSYSVIDYTVACICPMGVELAPVKAMLDQIHPDLPMQKDQNGYVLGDMAGHCVVIAVLPETGTNAAAAVAVQLLSDFPAIRFGLLVGIGGGVPDDETEEEAGTDVRLGDVVVSKPIGSFGGVVQYDLGKYTTNGGWERTGLLNKPPALLRSKMEQLAADHRINGSQMPLYLSAMLTRYPAMTHEYSHPGVESDKLFRAAYVHVVGRDCRACDRQWLIERADRPSSHPKMHYGTIGSANVVVKDALLREQLRNDMKLLCVEMEAAGLMNNFPCLVIRGICDYADSHKNKRWQPYAAATAAAYMKELLSTIAPKTMVGLSNARNVVQTSKYDRGLNLFNAPEIEARLFVGREDTLQQMHVALKSSEESRERKVLVLGGMGGIGKTQLAIAYTKRHRDEYSSIFWFNATSEVTLRSSLRLVAKRILPSELAHIDDDDQIQTAVLNWLSEPDNTRWLLIFDNYDEPEQYSVSSYYPYTSHGSIIITSRLPDHVPGRPAQVQVRTFTSDNDGLEILSRRSEREGIHDAGLPLALATAGAFLHQSKSTWSIERYLEVYEQQWHIDPHRPLRLSEYDKTLYTTWNMTYTHLERHDPIAAQMLKLLAYFDHQAIWDNLFHPEAGDNPPEWLQDICKDSASFESVMRVLVDYYFIEKRPSTSAYSIHACVHDWALAELNSVLDDFSYWFVFDCVTLCLRDNHWQDLEHIRYIPLTSHAVRLTHDKLREIGRHIPLQRLLNAKLIVFLLETQMELNAATTMCLWVLEGKENTFGTEHPITLNTVNFLGKLYVAQNKLGEAEQAFVQALAGWVQALGPAHTLTYDTVHNLGSLYALQDRLVEAEQMYTRALGGRERLLGANHPSTLDTVGNLGKLYADQGKLAEAEQMFTRALAASETVLGFDHTLSLRAANNLGVLYIKQRRLAEAEHMFTLTLAGYEKRYGLEHVPTLHTIINLGNLYFHQDNLAEAEQMYERALPGSEELLGPDHTATLDIVSNLGSLYRRQGRLTEAEQMYTRVLAGKEKQHGEEHSSTLDCVDNLGSLYRDQGKLTEAELMYTRALAGYEKVFGPEHPSTRQTALNLHSLRNNGSWTNTPM